MFGKVKRVYAARERNLWCRDCCNAYQRVWRKEWARKFPERLAARKRLEAIRKYGLTTAEHEMMKRAQGGVCAICLEEPQRDHDIDHCHKTGVVRGLLCSRCNKLLGMAKDNPELLRAAAGYLVKHGGKK